MTDTKNMRDLVRESYERDEPQYKAICAELSAKQADLDHCRLKVKILEATIKSLLDDHDNQA